jgi:hypothetical protein
MDVTDELVKIFDSNSHLLRENFRFQSKEDWKKLSESLLSVDAIPQYSLPVILFPSGEMKENLYMVEENAKEKIHTGIYSIVIEKIFHRAIYEIYRDSEDPMLKVFAIVFENYDTIKRKSSPKGKNVLKTWLNYFYGSELVNRQRIKFAISSLIEELFHEIEVIYLEVDMLFFYAEEFALKSLLQRLKEISMDSEIELCTYLLLLGKGKYVGFSDKFFHRGLQEYLHET